ncbi:MAG: zinc ribbon domain-containing protein [Actinomycetota bacterium]|nr:zinc ribbon domain-containing protein [Actinomycetota bacterium]
MPIYEYRCPNGHVFELFQRMDDPQPKVCEVCGEGPVERVLYPVAVHYKGSGFYSTDYGRGGRKEESGSKDGSSSSDDGDGGEKKKEKKEKKEATEA